jgi:ABC-type nickel/cobalt efflux system permease component RcnA
MSAQRPISASFTTIVVPKEGANVLTWEYAKKYVYGGNNADIAYIDGNIVQHKPLLLSKTDQPAVDRISVQFDLRDTEAQRDNFSGFPGSVAGGGPPQKDGFFVNASRAMKSVLERNYIGKDPSPFFAMVGILIALFAGALHAVTPGHGKSLMAAFLIGKKESKWSDAVILALSITVAHTIIIFLLGIIFFYFSEQISVYVVIPYFEKINGLLLIGIAYYLLRHAYRNKTGMDAHAHHHSTGAHVHTHHHQDELTRKIVSSGGKWDLFVAGLSGGIIPCVDALSILIAFVSIGRSGLGILFVLFFSIGMACAIISIGVILVIGKEKTHFEERFKKIAAVYAPIGAALFMIAVSFSLLF